MWWRQAFSRLTRTANDQWIDCCIIEGRSIIKEFGMCQRRDIFFYQCCLPTFHFRIKCIHIFTMITLCTHYTQPSNLLYDELWISSLPPPPETRRRSLSTHLICLFHRRELLVVLIAMSIHESCRKCQSKFFRRSITIQKQVNEWINNVFLFF